MRRFLLLAALALGACTTVEITILPPAVPVDAASAPDVSLSADAAADASDDRGGSRGDDAGDAPADAAVHQDAREILDAGAEVGVPSAGEDAAPEADARADISSGGGNPFRDASGDSPRGPLFDPCAANPRPGFDPGSGGLAECCAGVGPAHCVPRGEVAGGLADQLASCDTASVCMPDEIIRAGGQYRPATCTSVLGAGACLSRCISIIRDNPQAALLQQNDCAEGDLCVPCFTGACTLVQSLCGADSGVDATDGESVDAAAGRETSVAEGAAGDAEAGDAVRAADGEAGALCPYQGPPLIDPAVFPACAPACGGAHCVPQSALPASAASLFAECTSLAGAPGFCAPDAFIASAGNAVPAACSAFADTAAPGRCLSSCLPAVAAQTSLEQSTCTAGSRCVPCHDPFTGAPTGACSIACDAPPGTPFTFAGCCASAAGFDGRCVPRSQIADVDEPNLLAGSCTGASLCVPNDLLPGAPPSATCNATIVVSPILPAVPYSGRCLSSCLNLGIFATSPQGDCSADHVCMPCSLVPTAPGCP